MTGITIEKYAGKMNRAGYDAFLQAMRHARSERNRYVDVSHWLFHALSNQNADISATLRALGIDRGRMLKDLDQAIAALDKNVTETPGVSDHLADTLNHAWTYATLFFGEAQIRTGHVLVAMLNDQHMKRQLLRWSPLFDRISCRATGTGQPQALGRVGRGNRCASRARWTRSSGATRRSARSSTC
jgi:type VI secretion system protein VasG